jgi:hypothetical protein
MSTGDSLPLAGWPAAGPPRASTPSPPTVLWRWRYEIAMASIVPLILWSSAKAAGGLATLAGAAALLALIGLVGPLRRWLVAVAWSLITPHRVLVACAEAGVVSADGKLPRVLFTRRASYGERVYLCCPSGLCPEDVGAARTAIAAVCWAAEVRVFKTDGQLPSLVALEVVRRPAPSSAPGPLPAEHRAGPSLTGRLVLHSGRSSAAPDTRDIVW